MSRAGVEPATFGFGVVSSHVHTVHRVLNRSVFWHARLLRPLNPKPVATFCGYTQATPLN